MSIIHSVSSDVCLVRCKAKLIYWGKDETCESRNNPLHKLILAPLHSETGNLKYQHPLNL